MGRRKIKGNMDTEIAIDVMEMAKKVDHIVLFSGDGDFRRLIEAVQRKAVRVSVVSTMRSSPPMLADELRRQAGYLHRDAGPRIADRARPVRRKAAFRLRRGPITTPRKSTDLPPGLYPTPSTQATPGATARREPPGRAVQRASFRKPRGRTSRGELPASGLG